LELLDGREKLLGSANWNALAELDPLWTILSEPEKKFGKWDRAEFFGTGAREAERVLEMCRSNAVNVSYGKLLDFGCGVGRMTRAFSGFFQSCIGIDVSESMVSLARNFNCDEPRCDFVASDTLVLPFADKTFDFVFSVLVLQHLPSKSLILSYIAEFVRVAKDDGFVVFQLPNEVPLRRRVQLRRRLWSLFSSIGMPRPWLFKKLGLVPIIIDGISRQEIEKFILAQGGRVQAVERYDPSESRFHSYYYFVTKQRGSSSQDIPHEGPGLAAASSK
jgi:ubiquinone/menaquinone biosynthesis C-methylase UbiE